jgi:hypothetical protein
MGEASLVDLFDGHSLVIPASFPAFGFDVRVRTIWRMQSRHDGHSLYTSLKIGLVVSSLRAVPQFNNSTSEQDLWIRT